MKLFPFQEEGVKACLKFLTEYGSAYLADEMGIGKTAQSISAANELKRHGVTGPTLVICPSVMKYTWVDELKNWSIIPEEGLCISVLESTKDIKKYHARAQYIIVSYDLVARPQVLEYLGRMNFGVLILDEAHYLKNEDAKRTQAVLNILWNKAKYRLALSGTPFLQSVVDGFSLFSRMAPDLFPHKSDFVTRYSFVDKFPVRTKFGTKWIEKYVGVKNGDELSSLIRQRFFVRRRKEEVLKELPPKLYTKITLPKLPESTQNLEELAFIKKEIEAGRVPTISDAILSRRQEECLTKIKPISEFCKELLDQDIPLVVFLYHRSAILTLGGLLSEYEPYIITGDTPSEERAQQVRSFQEGGKRKLFILQIKAGGVGITLHRSSTVVLGELDWNPGTISQAVDRVHRIGTTATSINIYYFVHEDSVEEAIESTVIRKAQEFNQVIN